MWNRSLALFLCIFLSTPLFASAISVAELQDQLDRLVLQIAQLQKTISIQSSGASSPAAGAARAAGAVGAAGAIGSCPNLARNLSRGMQGDDVRVLQSFLQARGLLSVEPTGFFGELSEMALKAFQSQEGIVSSGTPTTSGWGFLGPRTRTVISGKCGVSTPAPVSIRTGVAPRMQMPSSLPPSTPKPPDVVAPKVCTALGAPSAQEKCLGVWEKLYDSSGCAVGWSCRIAESAYAINKAPSILSMDGPSEVFVNQANSWSIRANDPEGGSLEYSMIWGDEGSTDILSLLAGLSKQYFTASSKQTHTYTALGSYTSEITVRDKAGNEATATFPVRVVARMASTSTSTAPTSTSGSFGSCVYAGASYPDGTVSEGYSVSDLCLVTGGVCTSRAGYIPKYTCEMGMWNLVAENPYPSLPNYGNVVGTQCSQHGATQDAVVAPNTQLCRGVLCATAQNYAKLSLKCSYTNWVDWGLFTAGATTTTICANHTPCEYGFGQGGRACAARQSNGQCESAPFQNHPI